MIDFDIPADLAALRDEIRAFVCEKIVPYETDPRLTRHGPDDSLRAEMVDLMTDVKVAGLRLGALTNDMTAFHGPGWVERQEHLKLFDVIVDGSLTGVMKPDPRAFGQGAGALGLPADQIVFLDDMPWNVEAAGQAGMTAVRVPWDDPGPAIDAARNLLRLSPRQPGR